MSFDAEDRELGAQLLLEGMEPPSGPSSAPEKRVVDRDHRRTRATPPFARERRHDKSIPPTSSPSSIHRRCTMIGSRRRSAAMSRAPDSGIRLRPRSRSFSLFR